MVAHDVVFYSKFIHYWCAFAHKVTFDHNIILFNMKYLILLTIILLVSCRDDPKYDSLFRTTPNLKDNILLNQEMHWF